MTTPTLSDTETIIIVNVIPLEYFPLYYNHEIQQELFGFIALVQKKDLV